MDSGVIHLALSDNSLIFACLKLVVQKLRATFIAKSSYKHYSKSSLVNDLRDIDWSLVDNEPDINTAVYAWNMLFTESRDGKSARSFQENET